MMSMTNLEYLIADFLVEAFPETTEYNYYFVRYGMRNGKLYFTREEAIEECVLWLNKQYENQKL